jgi:ribonuclease-3
MPPPSARRPAARPPAHFEDDEPPRREPPARRERQPAPQHAHGGHREMPASRREPPPIRREPRDYDDMPARRSRPERSEPARREPPPRTEHHRDPAPRAGAPPHRAPAPARVPPPARPPVTREPAPGSWLITPPLPEPAPRTTLPPPSPAAATPVKIAPSTNQAEANANLRAAWAPLMQVLGYDFRDITLLERGLTHSSSKGQAGGRYHDNETMEFLGDSVLGLVIAEWLYEKLPEADEGVMSKLKSHLVSTKNMAEIAMGIRIPDFMILGGSGVSEARKNERLVCSTLEAVTGAIFLDGGYEPSKRMLRKIFYEQMRNLNPQETMEEDAKSTIQEYLQTKHHMLPHYESFLHKDAGDKIYITVIKARGQVLGEGMGKAKKDSQQDAARRSLERLRSGLVKIK